MKKSVTILLPDAGVKPAGGFKIALDYANALSDAGYQVHVVYACTILLARQSLYMKIKMSLRWFKYIFNYSAKEWHPLKNNIKEHFVFSLNYRNVPKTSIYVATAAGTSVYLNQYPIDARNKFYLIQDYETWCNSDEFLRETYHYAMKKIVISNWLKDIISGQEKEQCHVVPNGFNPHLYKISIPIKEKDKYSISMLYNDRPQKDMATGLKALEHVHDIIPQIKVHLFGTGKNHPTFPEWIEYHYRPSKEEHLFINNKCAIYLGSSKEEGWGLTVGEAMMCGQAVVCTNNRGYLEMVNPDSNALVCNVGDYRGLSENIVRLINDDELRYSIAYNGFVSIQNFKEDKSAKMFVSLIEQTLK